MEPSANYRNRSLAGAGQATDCSAARESAQSTLRNHANQLRRQAGELHKQADRIEQLANVSAGLVGPAEEALWHLAINGINTSAPRLF